MAITRVAITLFVAATVLGPIYTAPGYSPVANVISELAAQNTPRNYLMASAFVALGAAVMHDGIRAFRRSLLPFMVFGIAFGAAGLFGHKPISGTLPYSVAFDAAHSVLAALSGTALTLGFAWQAAAARSSVYKLVAASLAVVCVVLPVLMLNLPQYQGFLQRVMYLGVFAWLWVYYPARVHV